jgi:linoleoyl-CoA desaturase
MTILEREVTTTLTLADLATCKPSATELQAAGAKLRRKAIAIGLLAVVSYLGLITADGPAHAIPFALALVVGIIAISTGVMHDANHGAFGTKGRLGPTLMFTADLLGASSWFWRQKHNVVHHGNTNVVGVDADIEQLPFARLAPGQSWKPAHRFQHIYMWALYGFLTAEWVLFSDFGKALGWRKGNHPASRQLHRRDVVHLFAGKAVHVGWAFVLPMVFHRWWTVVAFYFGCSWLVGFTLALFFQLAHCVDTTAFVEPATPRRGDDFVLHQLRTTANIRCATPVVGPFIGWLMGGLHHQIEHHLAPGVPHTTYPAMSLRLQALCAERGIVYLEHTSLLAALRSHARWLRFMGRRPLDADLAG